MPDYAVSSDHVFRHLLPVFSGSRQAPATTPSSSSPVKVIDEVRARGQVHEQGASHVVRPVARELEGLRDIVPVPASLPDRRGGGGRIRSPC